jgi:opacity protein-like surface antigen
MPFFTPTMRRPLPMGTLALAAALACGQAAARDKSSPEAHINPTTAPLTAGEIKAQREFKLLDFNGDGKLSRSEVALFPRLAAAFDDADTDHDGLVSYEEVRAFAVKYRAQREKERAAAEAKTDAAQRSGTPP